MDPSKTLELLDRPGVRKVFETFEKNGFEIYIVGGAVRDTLLGLPIDDIDFTTNARPDQIADLFDFSITVGARFGTVQVFVDGESFEVTTYRTEGDYKDGRHPSSLSFGNNLVDDLKRRDFTINGLVVGSSGSLLDFVGGLGDLEKGIIRTIGDPMERFGEDKLRKWRCVRFAAEKSFELDLETHRSIVFDPETNDVSFERIQGELNRIILSDKANWGGYLLVRTGLYPMLLRRISPRAMDHIEEWQDLVEPFEMLPNLPKKLSLRLAALLLSQEPDDAAQFLRAMRYPNKVIKETLLFIQSFGVSVADGVVTYKKMAAELGRERLLDLCALQEAAALADQDKAKLAEIKRTKDYAEALIGSEEPLRRSELDINGKEIEEMGYRNREISECFNFLLEQVYADPSLNTKSSLKRLLRDKRPTNEPNIPNDN